MSEKWASDCAPILLIGFNRPDFMRAQIAAVRVAQLVGWSVVARPNRHPLI